MSESSMQVDEEPQVEFFKLHSDNQIPSSVVKSEWHPDKDLLVMVTEDGKIVLHRLNWDKLWTISPGQKVTSICWRPDGKALAVGLEDGTISLYDVENGKMLRSNKSHSAAVVCLSWAEEDQLELGDAYDLFSYEDRTSRFFPPPKVPPVPKAPLLPGAVSAVSGSTEDQDAVDQDFIDSSRQQLSILCSGDEEGIIYFSIFGVYPIGKMNIGELSVISSQDGFPQDNGISYRLYNASLYKMVLSNDLRQIIVLCYGTLTEGMDSNMEDTQDQTRGLYCLLINTSIFEKRHKELYQVALQVSSIERLFEVFSTSLKVIQQQWSSTMRSIRNNLTPDPFLSEGNNWDIKTELVDLLCGCSASKQLQDFFKDYGEGPLKVLARRTDTACKEIHKIIVEHLQVAAEIIAFRVGELKGLSRWHSRMQNIGLDERLIDHALEDAGMLVIQIERLLRILAETLYQFQNFFNWLKESFKHEAGEQIPVINSELVMLFLNTVFEQDYITQHLELVQEDAKVEIDSNAMRRLKEMVEFGGYSDVFYLQRTLSCQFNCLQRSCKEAFSMPFTVVSQKLFCEDIMLLSYVPKVIKFKEPVSITYYKEPANDYSQDIESKVQDYICFQIYDDTTPDNPSVVVIMRGFTHGGRFQHSESNNKKVEVTALCIQKGFRLIDLALYKENQVILLMNDHNSTSVVARLMLLRTNSLPFVSFSSISKNVCLLDIYRSKEVVVELCIEDGIFQLVPHAMVASLAVSVSRGLACVFTSQRRALVYILEEDEGEGEDEDEDEDE